MFPEHIQYRLPLDVQHIGSSNVPHISKTSSEVGLSSWNDTCTCVGGVTLSECHASSCKRKRMDLEDASKTGLQKRVRYHMDLEVMPSGLLRIVCIPVMDHGTSYVSNVYDDSYVMHNC